MSLNFAFIQDDSTPYEHSGTTYGILTPYNIEYNPAKSSSQNEPRYVDDPLPN